MIHEDVCDGGRAEFGEKAVRAYFKILFFYFLVLSFNNAVSNSNYIVQNDQLIVNKELEFCGSGHVLLWGPNLACLRQITENLCQDSWCQPKFK
jgi:hypothetical protein